MELRAMHRSFSLAGSTITFFLLGIPSILSSVYSPPLSGALTIFPLPRCSRFPPFSPSRTCVCARAPSDFFPVFTHRSFFPFRNIIGGAMHLSPFPSPPSGPPRSPASPGVRTRSLAPRVRLRRISCGRVPATR